MNTIDRVVAKKEQDNAVLLALAIFKGFIDKNIDLFGQEEELDEIYDEMTLLYLPKDVYSNPNQLDMFDENVHVKDVK